MTKSVKSILLTILGWLMNTKINKSIINSIFVLFLVCSVIFCYSCVSTKSNENIAEENANVAPIWLEDEGRYQLFPKELFVSAIGSGSSAQEAQNRASDLISRAIKTSITSSVESAYNAQESKSGEKSASSYAEFRKLNQEIKTTADNALFNVNYTTPYFNEKFGMYQCVSYIDREESWNMIEPRLNVASSSFLEDYNQSMIIKDKYTRILALKNAQKKLKEFYEYYDFALFINNSAAQKFKRIDNIAQESFSEVYFATQDCRIKVIVNKDPENRVKSKITSKLSETGFIVGSMDSNYEFNVNVSYDIKQSADLWLSYPSIKISVYSESTIVDSYAKEIGKVASFDKADCERRIFKELENAIEEMGF